MNKKMGVAFYNGRVVDVDLTSGAAIKTVKVKLGSEEIQLKAKHVIDAAGRRFIIGHKTDNVLFGAENLFGLNNGSAWVRVKNVDRTIFHSYYVLLCAKRVRDESHTSVNKYNLPKKITQLLLFFKT